LALPVFSGCKSNFNDKEFIAELFDLEFQECRRSVKLEGVGGGARRVSCNCFSPKDYFNFQCVENHFFNRAKFSFRIMFRPTCYHHAINKSLALRWWHPCSPLESAVKVSDKCSRLENADNCTLVRHLAHALMRVNHRMHHGLGCGTRGISSTTIHKTPFTVLHTYIQSSQRSCTNVRWRSRC